MINAGLIKNKKEIKIKAFTLMTEINNCVNCKKEKPCPNHSRKKMGKKATEKRKRFVKMYSLH